MFRCYGLTGSFPSRAALAVAALACLAWLSSACGAAVRLTAVEDATTAARVKSALVNDDIVGIHPIEVRVVGGVVRLIGHMPTAADIERAAAIARGVPGVADVRSELVIGTPPPVPDARASTPSARAALLDREPAQPTDRRLLGIGASFGLNDPRHGRLDSSLVIGPLVRLGAGRGFGPSVGFGWFSADLDGTVGGIGLGETVGRVRIRPVMGGVGYTIRRERVSLATTIVAGIAVNRVDPADVVTGRAVPLGVSDSFVWRPGLSFWLDATPRVALNVSAGYAVTRPRLTMLEDGVVVRRRMTADALVVRAGLVYKLF